MIKVNNVVKTFDRFRALDGLSMTVEKGSIYGLVGPNGAGKSTILRHITGAYRPDSGTVLIDGVDVRELSLASLRRSIGVVQQDVYLFSGSVYDNIAYGKPGATREEVEEAARLAGAEEFIKLGATRLGTSRIVKIAKNEESNSAY